MKNFADQYESTKGNFLNGLFIKKNHPGTYVICLVFDRVLFEISSNGSNIIHAIVFKTDK